MQVERLLKQAHEQKVIFDLGGPDQIKEWGFPSIFSALMSKATKYHSADFALTERSLRAVVENFKVPEGCVDEPRCALSLATQTVFVWLAAVAVLGMG